MWFKSHFSRASVIIVMALALFAFTSSAQMQPSNAQTLVIDSISQPESLDPAWSFLTADSSVLEQIYDHLVDYRLGSTSEFDAEIAEEVPSVANGLVSPDLKTYTFNIRSGIQFWDGTELTCEDVEYSFERFLAMDRASGGTFLMLIPAIGIGSTRTTVDDETVLRETVEINGVTKSLAQAIDEAYECDGSTFTVSLADPFPVNAMMSLMAHASSGSVYSKAFAISQGAADNANRLQFLVETNGPTVVGDTPLFSSAMGSGPFRLQVWDRTSEQVILGRNDDFRDGPATLQNVIYSNIPEFTTRLLRLQNGDADVSYISERTQTATIKDNAPSGVRLIEGLPGFTTETVHMDQSVASENNTFLGSATCDGFGIPPDFFADPNVRLGFSHSFSQEQFIEDFLLGAGVVVATPIPPIVEFFDPEVEAIPFDPDAAEAAFKEAQCGDAGSVWDVGFSFTAVFNEGNTRRQTALQQLEFNVESLNARRAGLPAFQMEVIGQPGPTVLNNAFQLDTLPMFVFGWSPDFIDIDNWIRQWMDCEAGSYSSATMPCDAPGAQEWLGLLNDAFQETDAAARQVLYTQLQQDYVDNALAITLPSRTLDNVERTWVNGNFYNPGEGDPQNPPNVYLLSKIANGKANEAELAPYGPDIIEF